MFASSSPSYRLINGDGADTFRNKVHISYENHRHDGYRRDENADNRQGYGDAAVVFQRDWNLNPQNLPFAENIKPQSLRLLCQKGLFHHRYQQEILVQVSYHNDED